MNQNPKLGGLVAAWAMSLLLTAAFSFGMGGLSATFRPGYMEERSENFRLKLDLIDKDKAVFFLKMQVELLEAELEAAKDTEPKATKKGELRI